MKKMLLVLLALLSFFAIVSCKQEPPHVHTYTTNKVECSICHEKDYSRAITVTYNGDWYELDVAAGNTYVSGKRFTE